MVQKIVQTAFFIGVVAIVLLAMGSFGGGSY